MHAVHPPLRVPVSACKSSLMAPPAPQIQFVAPTLIQVYTFFILCQAKLLAASTQLKDRLYPVYSQLQTALAEIQHLQTQLTSCKIQTSSSSELKVMKRARDDALVQVKHLQEEVAELDGKVRRRNRALASKDEEVQKLKEENRNSRHAVWASSHSYFGETEVVIVEGGTEEMHCTR